MNDLAIEQEISDAGGDLRRWRTELPNIIDDLGLDVFERALYGHYKRVCGAKGGTCKESTRTTAEKIPGMSAGQVSIVRRRLSERGLIVEDIQHTIHIKMVDIWKLNFAYYSVEDRPDIRGWTVLQLEEWVAENVYHLNGSQGKCLPGKQGVYEVNTEGEKCLPGKTKNQHPKKEPIEENGGGEKIPPTRDGTYLPEAGDQMDWLFGGRDIREGEKILQRADWDISNSDARQAMAVFLESSRLPPPSKREKSTRTDWVNSVEAHLEVYGLKALQDLYPRVIADMRGKNLTISRPGSVTNNMAAWWAENDRKAPEARTGVEWEWK